MDPYSWSWDPDALVLVPALGAAYVVALRRFPAPPARIASFFSGLVLLLAVLITPVDTIALHYLLSAHLLQNVVLAEWAPALLVLGLTPALAARIGGIAAVRLLVWPPVALALWLATYFLWHLPALYDAALEHSALLHLEHVCYVAAGTLLWWPVFQDAPHHLSNAARALYVFVAFVLASPIGLLLALLPEPVYDWYVDGGGLWGLSPHADQQIAGVAMSVEQAVVFFVVFAVFFFRFLADEEAEGRPAEKIGRSAY